MDGWEDKFAKKTPSNHFLDKEDFPYVLSRGYKTSTSTTDVL